MTNYGAIQAKIIDIQQRLKKQFNECQQKELVRLLQEIRKIEEDTPRTTRHVKRYSLPASKYLRTSNFKDR